MTGGYATAYRGMCAKLLLPKIKNMGFTSYAVPFKRLLYEFMRLCLAFRFSSYFTRS